jgi:ubiquinone/menaquinone biosynthesis C-methylase UbiE
MKSDVIPATRGLLVSGRAGLVDTLENMISGGQQEAILTATLDAAELLPGHSLIDVGCGTGKLVVAAARQIGQAGTAIGVDATPEMIDLALARATEHRSAAQFRLGVAESLPAETASMDAVTSSYFFHHLPSDVKYAAIREMWRVLKPGGRLVITDYGRPRTLFGFIASIPMRFDFHEYVRPQLRGELERIIKDEGLATPEVKALFLGYIGVLQLIKPH